MCGSHLIKAYSRTQSNITLSLGEDEFYALVAGASEALGIVAMSEFFGAKFDAYLYADASAAIGMANRECWGGSIIWTPGPCGSCKRVGSADWGWTRPSGSRSRRTLR